MVSSVSPSNLDELLSFVSQLVNENYNVKARSTDGAVLAHQIRQRYPGFEYSQFSMSRLADLVREAESRGLVTRDNSFSHLVLLPYGKEPTLPVSRPRVVPFRRINPPVWSAFVRLDQDFSSFLNRKTGYVERRSLGSDVTGFVPPGTEGDWVRIAPITPETQKGWARAFLDLIHDLPAEEAPLREERWWDAFTNWIRQNKPTAEIEWKKFRTTKVIEFLHSWAKENGINADILFVEPAVREQTQAPPKPLPSTEAEKLRQAILRALAEMPLPELTRLPIPLQYLIPFVSVK